MTVGSRLAAMLVRLPAPRTTDVSVERDLAAKMPDGATLLADRWFPTQTPAEQPTILVRTPYGRRIMGPLGRLYAERGYQVVFQSCRGTFGSEGEFDPMRNERTDGRATLEWVAAQPWFDGRLVTWGGSYLGLTQWAVTEDVPDFVKAMALHITASDFRDGVVYPGNSFALETALAWMHQITNQERGFRAVIGAQMRSSRVIAAAANVLPLGRCDVATIGETAPFYQEWLEHGAPGDTWWDAIDFGRHPEQVPPASLVGGWYDIFLPHQVADYEALRDAGRDARLIIGPWHHGSPGLFGETIRDSLQWFDSQLSEGRGTTQRAPVRVFDMGLRKWEEFSRWPPVAETQRWYLGRWGTLGLEAPAVSGADHFHYNPHDPTPGVGGASLNLRSAGRKDQRRREHRHDVLTYTSPVLTDDLTVIGPLSATLHLCSSLEHTDFHVRLCDVTPKGKSFNLSDGIVRLAPNSVRKRKDGSFTLEVPMWPTANTFKAGHRIRLQVASGAHPLFARNAGTGEPLATGSNLRSADQEVFHDEARPSSIALPVVKLFQ
jgi:putative CocE/NonD family hydrolase